MNFCTSCNVTYSPKARVCALCGRDLVPVSNAPDVPEAPAFPQRLDRVQAPPEVNVRRRGLWVVVLSVCYGIPAGVSLLVDLLVSQGTTWSPWVMISLSLAWALTLSAIVFMDFAIPMLIAMTMASLGHLYLFSLLQGNPAWYWSIALPIVIALAGSILVVMGVWVISGRNFHVLWSMVLLAASAISLVTEWVITSWLGLEASLGWSFIVLVSCLPVAALIMVVGIAYRRSSWVRRVLHW